MKPPKLAFTGYDDQQWAAIKHFLHGVDAERLVALRAKLERLGVQYFKRSQLKFMPQLEWERLQAATLEKVVALRSAFASQQFERLLLFGDGCFYRDERTADQLADEAYRVPSAIEYRLRAPGSVYDLYEPDELPTAKSNAEKALRTDYLRGLIRVWEQISGTEQPRHKLARFLLACAEPVGINLKAIQYSLGLIFPKTKI